MKKIIRILGYSLLGSFFVLSLAQARDKAKMIKVTEVPANNTPVKVSKFNPQLYSSWENSEDLKNFLQIVKGREASLINIENLEVGGMRADCNEMQIRESFMTSLSHIEIASHDPSVMISHNDTVCLKGFNALSIMKSEKESDFIFILSNVSSRSVMLTSLLSEAARKMEAQAALQDKQLQGRKPASVDGKKENPEVLAVPAQCRLSKKELPAYTELFFECRPKVGKGLVRWRVFDPDNIDLNKLPEVPPHVHKS